MRKLAALVPYSALPVAGRVLVSFVWWGMGSLTVPFVAGIMAITGKAVRSRCDEGEDFLQREVFALCH